MNDNGIDIALGQVTKAMMLPGAAMIVGLLFALLITYRKDRAPKEVEGDQKLTDIDMAESITDVKKVSFNLGHVFTILAIIAALIIQLVTESLVLGALAGIIVMFATRVVEFYKGDKVVNEGVGMMGMIAFVMLIASGYASVLKETGHIDELVEATIGIVGDSHFLIGLFLLLVGLLITMGIGTSFGTIPILAALYVPIFIATGISPVAGAALIGTAAALGDAGSPASDSTLGPTSGLNADGKHHHIWDTCVPTFLHYNIPLFLFGLLAVIIF